ncbi:HNH endonuclease [Demequina mangrovi]|uniref:HNH endonuclease n=2 Tax=Demequina mangrovi TaxID=1043493 RepID=A0A1H7AQ00_9MICO|nr:HNH endonuclease [Demequina mangrovi]
MRALTAEGGSPGREVLGQLEAVALLAREVDMVLARLSREAQRLSDEAPGGGLARRHGHRGAADLVASTTGGTRAEAQRLLDAGRALEGVEPAAPTSDPALAPTPVPRHPHVAAALDRLEISVDCATQIIDMLDALEERVEPDRLTRAERELVARARGMSATRFAAVVRRTRAALDIHAHEKSLARMRASRWVRMYEDRDGMVVLSGRLDPETAAPVRAALDGLVGDAMRRSKDALGEDTRSTDQMRADALSALSRHGLGCTATDLPLSTVTVIVRIAEKDLHAGLGLGEVDGTSTPVDVATVRRMAADAHLIPAVLGSAGELLDLGRRRRLFTRSQRLALGERDGGCAFCGAPQVWTDAHHIQWWGRDHGRTDLANGVLLCGHCHTTVHTQGWDIHATATTIDFIPPASVDPARQPRPGGRRRFHAPHGLASRHDPDAEPAPPPDAT